MIEKEIQNSNKEVELEHKRHAEEVRKFHKASEYGYAPGSQQEQHFLDWERRFDKKEKMFKEAEKEEMANSEIKEQKLDDVAERVMQIISDIESVELLPEFSDDEEMKKKLSADKATARKLIKDLLTKDVREYASLVQTYDKVRVGVQDKSKSVEELKEFDQRRAIKHNALISSITIVNRFLTQKFGVMSDDELEEYEEQEENAGRTITETKRIPLPKNIICPSYLNLEKREDITDWAIDISRSLSEISL